jgi:hypothetical protein
MDLIMSPTMLSSDIRARRGPSDKTKYTGFQILMSAYISAAFLYLFFMFFGHTNMAPCPAMYDIGLIFPF